MYNTIKKIIVLIMCGVIIISLSACWSPFVKEYETPNFDHDEEFLEKKSGWDEREDNKDTSRPTIEVIDFKSYEKKDAEIEFLGASISSITFEEWCQMTDEDIWLYIKENTWREGSYVKQKLEQWKSNNPVLSPHEISENLDVAEYHFKITTSEENSWRPLEFVFRFDKEQTVHFNDLLNQKIVPTIYVGHGKDLESIGISGQTLTTNTQTMEWNYEEIRANVRAICNKFGRPTGVYYKLKSDGKYSSTYFYDIFWKIQDYVLYIEINEYYDFHRQWTSAKKEWGCKSFGVTIVNTETWASHASDESRFEIFD